MKILIVGAGIGGLVSALCLNKKGYEVEIYEQSEVLSELGAVSYTHLTLPTKRIV